MEHLGSSQFGRRCGSPAGSGNAKMPRPTIEDEAEGSSVELLASCVLASGVAVDVAEANAACLKLAKLGTREPSSASNRLPVEVRGCSSGIFSGIFPGELRTLVILSTSRATSRAVGHHDAKQKLQMQHLAPRPTTCTVSKQYGRANVRTVGTSGIYQSR